MAGHLAPVQIAILPADHAQALDLPHSLTVLAVCFLPLSGLGSHRCLVTTCWRLHAERLIRTLFPDLPLNRAVQSLQPCRPPISQ